MKHIWKLAVAVMVVAGLTGCGTYVEIPPAHVGKLKTPNGLQDGVIAPSAMRLALFCLVCDSLVLAEASDQGVKETADVFIPADNLNITVDVRGTMTLSPSPANVEKVFARIPATRINKRVELIEFGRVYATYAQPIIREAMRSVLTRYTIDHIMSHRDELSQEFTDVVTDRLGNSPVQVIKLGFANIQPPDVIVEAQVAAKQRQVMIQQEEANKLVRLKEAEGNLEVAIKQQEVELKEAETTVLVNRKLSEGMSQAIITRRALDVLTSLANSDNKVIVLPLEAISNPNLMVPLMSDAVAAR